jgi:hypothetical protein
MRMKFMRFFSRASSEQCNGKKGEEREKCILNASCRDRIIKNFALGHNKRASSFAIVDKIIKKSFNQFFRGLLFIVHFENLTRLRHGIFARLLPRPLHNCCD